MIKGVKDNLIFNCIKKAEDRKGAALMAAVKVKIMLSWNSREPNENHCDKLILNVNL
jgi:hypothetical protein